MPARPAGAGRCHRCCAAGPAASGWRALPRVRPTGPWSPSCACRRVGAFSDNHDLADEAVNCITSVESQIEYMLAEGNSGARAAVFDDPEIREAFPMADLIRDSIDTATPRPRSSYYPDISAATVREFHPPASVDPDSTPADADDLIVNVLQDKQLL